MQWPWRRFEAMWRRYLLRKERERLERHRDDMIVAINANSNWDMKENAEGKEERIKLIHRSTKEAIEYLYTDKVELEKQQQAEQEQFENDPFYRKLHQQALVAKMAADQPLPEQSGQGRTFLDSVALS